MNNNNVQNLSNFSRLIRLQLLQHNRVSLPGLGSFIVEDQPSSVTDGGRLINPPTRELYFSVKETWNDEFLEQAYALELEEAMLELEDEESTLDLEEAEEKAPSKLFLEQAKREVSQFVADIQSHLQSSGSFNFPGLGIMKMEGKRKEISFVKSADSDLTPESFGLSPLSVKPLPTPSRLYQPVMEKPVPPPPPPKPRPTQLHPLNPSSDTTPMRGRTTGVAPKRIPKWMVILLGIVLAVIIASLLVYIFQEELRPFLKWVLYTPAQRELLSL